METKNEAWMKQDLSPIYERQFSDHSYGFRPKRNAHQALGKCKDYITAGYIFFWVHIVN